MHNLSSSKVLTALKDNVTVHFEGHKDLQLQRTDISWWWGISVRKAVRHKSTHSCNISQKHSDHHDSQTSLQAVVTNDQLLAAQFKGSGTPRLLKLVQRAEGDKGREWEIGAKVKPKCYNYSCETWPGCLLHAPQCFSSAVKRCHLWPRGRSTGRSVHTHQLCSPGRSSAPFSFWTRSPLSDFTLRWLGRAKDENFARISALSSSNELLTCACF